MLFSWIRRPTTVPIPWVHGIKLSLSLTIRRVFQVFEDESITVLYMGSDRVKVLNLSLRPIHCKILALLGREL